MAKPNGQGGWHITDEEAAELLAKSGNVCPACGSGVLASGEHVREDLDCPREALLEQATRELAKTWRLHAKLGTRGSPETHCRSLARTLQQVGMLCESDPDR